MLGATWRRHNGPGLAPAGGPGPFDGGPGGGLRPKGGGGWFGPAPTGGSAGVMTALVAGMGMARNAFAPVEPPTAPPVAVPVAPPLVRVDRVIPPVSSLPNEAGAAAAGSSHRRPVGPSPVRSAGAAAPANTRRVRRMRGMMVVGAVVAGVLQGSGKRNLRRRRRMPW